MGSCSDRTKTLVISGYGHADCLLGAALLCQREQMAGREAELRLCSRDKLADELEALSAAAPGRLFLVGMGLSVNFKQNVAALAKLKTLGCEATWFSALPMPGWMLPYYEPLLELVVDDAHSLPELAFALGEPWGKRAATARQLLHGKDNGELSAFCDAAGFVNRVLPAARGREMLGLFLRSLRDDHIEPFSGKLGAYVRLPEQASHRELKGESPAMVQLRELARRAAAVDDLRVMILGETGTGKESVAHFIHLNSERWNKPFLPVNCASSNKELQESAFRGYCKGTFTGGNSLGKAGYFEEADGGTLFLDEVGELSLEAQAMLLRILEEKRVMRMGGHEEIRVDVRLIAATNKDLWGMVEQGLFREDLLYRLQEFTLRTPALSEVPEDIPTIANAMWWQMAGQKLPEEATPALLAYDWPGNSRELRTLLKFVHAMGGGDWGALLELYLEQSGRRAHRRRQETPPYPDKLDHMCALHCRRIYEECDNNISHAARRLGIGRATLRRYLHMQADA